MPGGLGKVVDEVEHEVAGEGGLDGFGASLPVDDDGGGGELVEKVEGFEARRDAASCRVAEGIGEGARERGVPHEVVAVERCVAVASAREHLDVGSDGESAQPAGEGLLLEVVVGGQSVGVVEGIDGGDGVLAVVGVAVFSVETGAEGEVVETVVECEAVFEVVVVDVGEGLFGIGC